MATPAGLQPSGSVRSCKSRVGPKAACTRAKNSAHPPDHPTGFGIIACPPHPASSATPLRYSSEGESEDVGLVIVLHAISGPLRFGHNTLLDSAARLTSLPLASPGPRLPARSLRQPPDACQQVPSPPPPRSRKPDGIAGTFERPGQGLDGGLHLFQGPDFRWGPRTPLLPLAMPCCSTSHSVPSSVSQTHTQGRGWGPMQITGPAHCASFTCASAASAWGSQKVISIARYSDGGSVRRGACSGCPVFA